MFMRHIINYVSTASAHLSQKGIQDLIEEIKKNNTLYNITGIFIHADGNFFQVLEGETQIVKALFNTIMKDTRHYNVIKLLDEKIENPSSSKYYSKFTVISGCYSYNKLQAFLNRENNYNSKHFESISYLSQKFIKLS